MEHPGRLTLEDATAVKVTDSDGLRAAGTCPVAVAPGFACVMFDQLFNNGFFYVDPYPGNFFVIPDAGSSSWQLTFVGFGVTEPTSDITARGCGYC